MTREEMLRTSLRVDPDQLTEPRAARVGQLSCRKGMVDRARPARREARLIGSWNVRLPATAAGRWVAAALLDRDMTGLGDDELNRALVQPYFIAAPHLPFLDRVLLEHTNPEQPRLGGLVEPPHSLAGRPARQSMKGPRR